MFNPWSCDQSELLVSDPYFKVAAEAPQEKAVGRRLRVFWPQENEYYIGEVIAYDNKSGKHKVQYDDGDREDVLLAAERIEWIVPGKAEVGGGVRRRRCVLT